MEEKEAEAYRKSWRGKTSNSLYHYFLKFAFPLMLVVAMLEEANPNCPRYGTWKGKFNIPTMTDFLMVEVMNTNV